MYQANQTWLRSVRRNLRKILLDDLVEASKKSKPFSFLSHPLAECSCLRYDSSKTSTNASSLSTSSQLLTALGVSHRCPAWMDTHPVSQLKEKETEDDLDDDDSTSSSLFFGQNGGNHEGDGEVNNKDENQFEDQEELEGGER